MTPFVRFATHACWVASLAYGSRMKRAGRVFYVTAVCALYTSTADTEIIYPGRMPSTIASA